MYDAQTGFYGYPSRTLVTEVSASQQQYLMMSVLPSCVVHY